MHRVVDLSTCIVKICLNPRTLQKSNLAPDAGGYSEARGYYKARGGEAVTRLNVNVRRQSGWTP